MIMKNKHIRIFLVWVALLNWPPVLIWIPGFRMLSWLPFLLWINIPVQWLGLAKFMGNTYYKIQEFGAMPLTTCSWILIVVTWILMAIVLTFLTAAFSALWTRKRAAAQS
jgi:hypothetical protein